MNDKLEKKMYVTYTYYVYHFLLYMSLGNKCGFTVFYVKTAKTHLINIEKSLKRKRIFHCY